MNKKKLPYEEMSLEIVKILQSDILTTSPGNSPFGGDDENMDDSWTKQ